MYFLLLIHTDINNERNITLKANCKINKRQWVHFNKFNKINICVHLYDSCIILQIGLFAKMKYYVKIPIIKNKTIEQSNAPLVSHGYGLSTIEMKQRHLPSTALFLCCSHLTRTFVRELFYTECKSRIPCTV